MLRYSAVHVELRIEVVPEFAVLTKRAGVHDYDPLGLRRLVVLEGHQLHELRLPTKVDIVRPAQAVRHKV